MGSVARPTYHHPSISPSQFSSPSTTAATGTAVTTGNMVTCSRNGGYAGRIGRRFSQQWWQGLRMNSQPETKNTLKRVARECWRPLGKAGICRSWALRGLVIRPFPIADPLRLCYNAQ